MEDRERSGDTLGTRAGAGGAFAASNDRFRGCAGASLERAPAAPAPIEEER
jgi:hypothetical protein